MLSSFRPRTLSRLPRLMRPSLTTNAVISFAVFAQSFSTTPMCREGNSEIFEQLLNNLLNANSNTILADQALSAVLQEELKYEESSATDAPPIPDFLSKFKKAAVWKVNTPKLCSDRYVLRLIHRFLTNQGMTKLSSKGLMEMKSEQLHPALSNVQEQIVSG
jgi:hypothetical protein